MRRLALAGRISFSALWLSLTLACGGGSSGPTVVPLYDICGCVPSSPPSNDHRHAQKHVPLPAGTPDQITVNTILSWPIDPDLLPNGTPRSGRELQLFEIKTAYVQAVRIVFVDCDLHVEISDSPDKNAPRVIVETPIDSEYCMARQSTQQALALHKYYLGGHDPIELNPALPADVVGLAFEDFNHNNRGSAFVATIWEIHPAIVNITE